jgi:hypothetical protein
VLPVQRLDLVNGLSEAEQRRDDGAGRGPVDQVELLVEGAANNGFDFFQGTQRVEALRPATIEAQDAEDLRLTGTFRHDPCPAEPSSM